MQLKLSFSLLLSSLLLGYQHVDAVPVKRNPGMVTLPLKRLEHRRGDIHPQVFLQQHINRGHKRLARMTGRDEPSVIQLRANLERRLESLQDSQLEKRYNRHGVKKAQPRPATLDAATDPNATAGSVGAGNNAVSAPAQGVTKANKPTDANSLGLDIVANDVGYLATIQMGTPPQDYSILMDSGSADLWVGAENCQSLGGGGCGNHVFLGPKSSSSFVDTNAPFNVSYGTGSVGGDIIKDNIVVAGLSLPAHTFGVATVESVDFSSDAVPFDGLMGLAQSTLSQQQTSTPVESLATNGLITEAITSYKISRLADGKNDGEITFGGLDASKFDPKTLTTLANVSPTGFWEANMDAVTVDGTDTGLQGRNAILDTGTTLIIAPAADALAVHNAIPGAKSDGQGGFTVPCTTSASVALTFGGASFAIDPRDIAIAPLDPNNPTGDCVSGISSGAIGGATTWLVGDVFLKNAYFSTDVGKNQLQLAQLV